MSDELPQGWSSASFMDVFDIQGGTQPPKSTFKYEPTNGYVRLLQIRDFGAKPVPTFIQRKPTLKTCQKDDVLIGRYGASIGRICTGMEGAYNVALAKVIMPEQFERRFVFHLLQSPLFQRPILDIERSAQDGFNKEDLAEIVLPVAPLAEQRRIVAKLETLLGKVDASQQRLAKIPVLLKRFRQSVLAAACSGRLTAEWREEKREIELAGDFVRRVQVERKAAYERASAAAAEKGERKPKLPKNEFTAVVDEDADGLPDRWCVTRIGDISDCLDHIRVPINKTERLTRQGTIPYYGANGQVGVIDDYLFDEDLVLVVEDETFIGREIPFSYIIRGKSWVNNHAHVLRPLSGMPVDYLNNSLSYYDFTPLTSGTTGRRKLNQDALINAPLWIAPLPEQQEIVRRVEGLFALADQLEVRLAKARGQVEKLTPSLLARAFAGQLVPQDPTDEPAEKLLERIRTTK